MYFFGLLTASYLLVSKGGDYVSRNEFCLRKTSYSALIFKIPIKIQHYDTGILFLNGPEIPYLVDHKL